MSTPEKGAALLIKINEVIPQGFELIDKPDTYRVEDSYINMKGKRLDPLKAEELRLVLNVGYSFAAGPDEASGSITVNITSP